MRRSRVKRKNKEAQNVKTKTNETQRGNELQLTGIRLAVPSVTSQTWSIRSARTVTPLSLPDGWVEHGMGTWRSVLNSRLIGAAERLSMRGRRTGWTGTTVSRDKEQWRDCC